MGGVKSAETGGCVQTVITVMWAILLATYGAVFVAEIVGDKLLYTTGVLATRYRPVPIMLGMLCAFMAKMAVAGGGRECDRGGCRRCWLRC